MAVGGHGGITGGGGSALDAFAHLLASTIRAPIVLISVVTPHGQDVVGVHGIERPGLEATMAATALCRQIVHAAKPVIVHDVRRRIAIGSDALAALGVAGYAGVPIVVGGTAVGAVAALEHQVRAWSERDVELLRGFAEVVAVMLAAERARLDERALTDLVLAIAAAESVEDVLERIARHVGWPCAQLVAVENGRVRPIAAYDEDRPGGGPVATSWLVDVDHVVRDALSSGRPVWHMDVPGRDRVPAFAIAIPNRSVVLELFAGEVVRDPGDLKRIAPSVAAIVGSVLGRMDADGGHEQRTGELEVLALHDELTGVLNRRGFYAVAGGQLAVARRNGMPGLVLFIDLDGLKGVNDRDGHSAGDSLLRLAGSVLRSTFRDADTIARVGGDEFVVFSIDATVQDLTAVTDRLSRELTRANESARATSPLRWSVGHVRFDGDGVDSLDDLVVEADRRMYAIKHLTQLASVGFATRPEPHP